MSFLYQNEDFFCCVKLVLHKQICINFVITSLPGTLQTKAIVLEANSGFQCSQFGRGSVGLLGWGAGVEGEPAISSAASPGCNFGHDVTPGCGNNGGFAFHCCLLSLEN